jgi:KUP system potassium uptake protein
MTLVPAAGASQTRLTIRPPQPELGGVNLTLAALGVVFGDLGTSPLYTMRECLSGPHGAVPTDAGVLSVLSLIFWSLVVVISVKYLVFLMRADNDGEGGILALLALAPARHKRARPGKIGFLALLVIIGAALLFGDGIITPAVSVLSAIEGLEVATPRLTTWVVPITVAILLGLFGLQKGGTERLGRLFGPVMLLWFVTLAALGLVHVLRAPGVLAAVLPTHALGYFAEHGFSGVPILGGVVLCVTGGEALYADMGHFGRAPIRRAWTYICFPALVLSYFGQGAAILAEHDPVRRLAIADRSFYALSPPGFWLYALVVIATLATIIASQALISGVFSLTYQAIQLGFFPRLTVRHTSDSAEGQIYLPLMNWGLAVSCAALVLFFRESSKLAAAYGLAVSGTMAITTIAYFVVVRETWQWKLWKAALVAGLFLSFDVPFLVANSFKFWEGGYVPFGVGLVFVTIMVTWRIGRSLLALYFEERAEPLERFIAEVDERVCTRIPGTVVFMSSGSGVPPALRHLARRFKALHERVILLTIVIEHVPSVPGLGRVKDVALLERGFCRISFRYGFMDEPDVPEDLAAQLPRLEVDTPATELVYVVGRETFLATSKGRMGAVSEKLFGFLAHNAKSATDYFKLPSEQVIEVGAQIDL